MLKQRILTAIPLAALVIWGIFTQSENVVFYTLNAVIIIAGWEWARLSGINNTALRAVYALLIGVVVYFSQQAVASNPQWLTSILAFSVLVWLVAIYHMFSKGPQAADQAFSIIKFVLGFVFLIPPVLALVQIRIESEQWLFYCLSIIWIADIGAYFSGKRFGKNKLAPSLSPGKTKEGMYGAVFAVMAYSFLAGLYFELQVIPLLMLLIISALTTFISVAGDLFISLLKREKDLKDTGNILPGHGGILDRIDSVISASPFIALLLSQVIFNA